MSGHEELSKAKHQKKGKKSDWSDRGAKKKPLDTLLSRGGKKTRQNECVENTRLTSNAKSLSAPIYGNAPSADQNTISFTNAKLRELGISKRLSGKAAITTLERRRIRSPLVELSEAYLAVQSVANKAITCVHVQTQQPKSFATKIDALTAGKLVIMQTLVETTQRIQVN